MAGVVRSVEVAENRVGRLSFGWVEVVAALVLAAAWRMFAAERIGVFRMLRDIRRSGIMRCGYLMNEDLDSSSNPCVSCFL